MIIDNHFIIIITYNLQLYKFIMNLFERNFNEDYLPKFRKRKNKKKMKNKIKKVRKNDKKPNKQFFRENTRQKHKKQLIYKEYMDSFRQEDFLNIDCNLEYPYSLDSFDNDWTEQEERKENLFHKDSEDNYQYSNEYYCNLTFGNPFFLGNLEKDAMYEYFYANQDS